MFIANQVLKLIALLAGILFPNLSYCQSRDNIPVSRFAIPHQNSELPKDELIRKFILRPKAKKLREAGYYVFAADTAVHSLLECGKYSLYYTGQSKTDHTSSTYQLVCAEKQELLFFDKLAGTKANKKLLKHFFQVAGISRFSSERRRVRAKVKWLMKSNRLATTPSLFL